MAELLLFLAARAELVKTLIKPSLDEGYVIIADRFNLSTYAYQGEGLGLDVHSIERFASSGVSPTVTILLQASAETRLQRLTYRKPDAFEQRDKAYFERVERFYELAALDPELGGNIRLVSAEGAAEEVHARVLHEVIDACNF
jgi:dTMP kinase